MAEFSAAAVSFAAAVGAADPVTVVGGRSQWEIGGVPDPSAREVSAPAGIAEFEPAEMTVTCGAGTLVTDLQAELGAARQRVTLPDIPGATVGGVLAVGHCGPRRLGDGHIRDALLQVIYVDSDGALVRNGGPTVKNVSGFDLCKLMVGSFGTLGFLAEVILRCLPVAQTSSWFTTSGDPFDVLQRLYRPTSVLWDGSTSWVLLEGYEPDVDAEADELGLSACAAPPELPRGGRESLRPSELPDLHGEFVAEIGVGLVHRADPVAAVRPKGAVADLCAEVKRRFDPLGRLNPGRLAGS
jgi:FAD/FMN-containing dehydrogenase